MNLRYLKTFVAVAEHGNFARGANVVCLTQSAVSMQMRTLESLLGTELFDRSKRPATLNEQGESLVARAREIVELYELLEKDVLGPTDLPAVFHIGAVRSTITGIVPRALANIYHQFPGVSVTAVGGLPGELVTRVEQRELDAALVEEPRYTPPQLRWAPIVEEPLVLIASVNSDGDTADELLSSNPYIALNRGQWGGRMLEEYLCSRGFHIRPILEFDSFEAVIATVQRGLGVSILHRGCIDHPLRSMLRPIPLWESTPTRNLGLLYRPSGQRNPLIEKLILELKRVTAEQPDIWRPCRTPAAGGFGYDAEIVEPRFAGNDG